MKEHTEESLKASPTLQEVDRLCREEVSPLDGFVLVSKSTGYPKRNYLSSNYFSATHYQVVKNFYTEHLTRNGWRLAAENEGGWGPKHLEFRKGSYTVFIYHGGMGEEANYAIHCEKVSDSGAGTPR